MATQPRSLADVSISLHDFARYLNRNVITIRKWFEDDPAVVRTPRGSQREQIMIPIAHALVKCRQMGVPEILVQIIENDHKQRLERVAEPVPAAPIAVPSVRKRVKSAKVAKTKKRGKVLRAGGRR